MRSAIARGNQAMTLHTNGGLMFGFNGAGGGGGGWKHGSVGKENSKRKQEGKRNCYTELKLRVC